LIDVTDYSAAGWVRTTPAAIRSRWYCEQLEHGEILLFRDSQALVADSARASLLAVRAGEVAHKNVSYSPASQKLQGLRGGSAGAIRSALKGYSAAAIGFCAGLLAPYAESWRIELCSFRPIEERNRDLSPNSRNDLLHLDAFPGRPGNGARILRMFTNIHPQRPRIWMTSDPMPVLERDHEFAAMVRAAIGHAESRPARAAARLVHLAKLAGFKIPDRSPYDRVMLDLHARMKSSGSFQARCRKYRHEFEPGASWLVFTDAVPHAVLEGQYALEQSFFVPRTALVAAQSAPVSIVESFSGHPMTL